MNQGADLTRSDAQVIANYLTAEGPLPFVDAVLSAFPYVPLLKQYRAWCEEAGDFDEHAWEYVEHEINAAIGNGEDWHAPDRPRFAVHPRDNGDMILAPVAWFNAEEAEIEAEERIERERHTQIGLDL